MMYASGPYSISREREKQGNRKKISVGPCCPADVGTGEGGSKAGMYSGLMYFHHVRRD